MGWTWRVLGSVLAAFGLFVGISPWVLFGAPVNQVDVVGYTLQAFLCASAVSVGVWIWVDSDEQ